jgi:hypothetical protein
VVDIVPTHCVKEKTKHSSGSYHTNHSSQVVHAIWAWTTCLRLRKVHSRTSSLSVVVSPSGEVIKTGTSQLY